MGIAAFLHRHRAGTAGPRLPAPASRNRDAARWQRWVGGAALIAPLAAAVPAAHAQTVTTLVTPAIAPDYSRGRNISVAEQRHPSFEPVGVRLGAFNVFPSVAIATGVSDNVYIDNSNKKDDAFYSLQPGLGISSDWSIHRINISMSGELRRYARESLQNQNNFYINAQGQLDITSEIRVEPQVIVSRAAENPFLEDVASDVTVLSQYTLTQSTLRASRRVGRTRLIGSAERLTITYNDLRFANGTSRSQSERERSINRLAAQAEYALSPSISLYTQFNYDKTEYASRRLDGEANRDSSATLLIGGISFDLSGLMRGAVGVGWTRRNYTAPIYEDVNALSAQARVEFFVSPLTTVTVFGQRLVQDTNVGGAYIDTRAGGQIDHALLRNLTLTANASFTRQKLIETGGERQIYVASLSGFYQSTRHLGFGANFNYGGTRRNATGFGPLSDELRGQVTVRIRR